MQRRDFVRLGSLSAFEIFVMGCRKRDISSGVERTSSIADPSPSRTSLPSAGFGRLVPNPQGLLDLPKGFSYVTLQRGGDLMSDGFRMPFQPDGMACFTDDRGRYVLLRNHELGNTNFVLKYGHGIAAAGGTEKHEERYRAGFHGGVARILVDPKALGAEIEGQLGGDSKAVVSSNMALLGTDRNCAGGQFPDGWVSCEESSKPEHGYAFYVPTNTQHISTPRRIDSWGRMHREAVCLDNETGIVYMTEDRSDGAFFRHIPDDPAQPMGSGRLQALAIANLAHTDPYSKHVSGPPPATPSEPGRTWPVTWVDVGDPQGRSVPCRVQAQRAGATGFTRSEGMVWDGASAWFVASTAGPSRAGQVFQYTPQPDDASKGTLTLRYEVDDRSILSCPDNIIIAPHGDVILAEDNYRGSTGVTHQYIRGLTTAGDVYDIARNRNSFPEKESAGAEFTGICFSPDGTFLFVNLQSPENVTIAITGPWNSVVRSGLVES
jgi:uncharacterized protein